MRVVLPFLLKGVIPMDKEDELNEEPKPRSIILPKWLWEKIEKDAKRCRRSVNKQIEAVFVVFYGVESSVNIDEDVLTSTRDATSRKSQLKKTA